VSAMDYGFYSSVMTVIMLVVFLCIIAWAWSAKRQTAFEAAARVPLEDENPRAAAATSGPHDKETEK
jgi:cytochrome c oxidase cbb3-type subunit IV